jgi:uncharacterized protein
MINYIPRKEYIRRIEPFINKNIIKVLVGQRRVGKSFILRQLVDELKKQNDSINCIYINKESFEFDAIKNYSDLIEYVSLRELKDVKNALFIDEIQDIEEFEKGLRHFSLNENFDIYCTGSNANLLSGELATYLSGRYIEFNIYSLSYLEFLEFHQLDNSTNSLRKFLIYGGMPFLKNLVNDEDVYAEYLKNIYATILYKDIVSRFQIRNTLFLENLVVFLANNIGNVISANKISDYLKSQKIKLSPQLVINYLGYLSQAFLIFQVRRNDIVGKKLFEIHEKYYFEDWGFVNAIIGFQNMDIGKILENTVYMHLKIEGYKIFVGMLGDKEIDFVAEKNGKKIYIQVCYLLTDEKVKQREYGNLLLVQDNYPKYVVSLDEYAPSDMHGVKHLHLREFLSTKW